MMILVFIFLAPLAAISEIIPPPAVLSQVAVPLITSNYGGFNIRCFNGADGFVRVDSAGITGMSGPFSYLWSNGSTAFEITNVPAGPYSVVVTGSGGVTQSAGVTLTQPTPLVITTTVVDTARCNNGPTGKLKVSTAGGMAPYSYLWSTGATADSVFNVPGGNYTVTVTDSNGCTAQKIITLPSFPSISLTAVVTAVTCNGGTNGAIDLTVAGGVPGFTYLWTRNGIPVGTTQDLTNRTIGSYTVVVTDSKGCTAALTRTIGQPGPITLTVSTTQPSCNGGSNGIINLTVGGGVALPVSSYFWSSGQTTEDLNGVSAGNYVVTVTDANGCIRSRSFSLAQPAAVIPVAVATDITCFGLVDGSIDVTVTGGTGPGTYDFIWDFGSTDEDQTGLDAGTYTVEVTDANGCTGTTSATVNSPALLILSLNSVNVSCLNGSNGSITPVVSGGVTPYTYQWSNSATTQNVSGLTAGTYEVTVTDSNGCTASALDTITQPSTSLIVNLVAQANVNCNGDSTGALTVSASGGVPPYISYVWSNGLTGPSVSNLPAGTFTVTVTDSVSCSVSSSYIITQPPPVTVVPTIIPVLCYGQSNGGVNPAVQGGNPPYQYLWSTGSLSQNLTGVQAGSYSVTITYNQSCQDIFTYQVPQPDSLQITASITNVACRGASTGSIGITVTGGNPSYSYLWSTGAITQFISGLSAGTYTVSVTDSKNCTLIRSFIVTQPATVLSASAASTPETCDQTNGTATVTATGGVPPYTYQWNPTGQTSANATGLDAGTYTVTVTDSFGCSVTAQTTVATGPFPVVINSSQLNVSCFQGNNGSISVVAGGSFPPYTYNWSNSISNDTITNLTAGTYTVTITDVTGCSNDSSFTITQPSSPVRLNVVSKQNVNCFGQSTGKIKVAGIGGTPGYTYQWSPPGSTTDSIGNLTAGTYTVTVTDSKGCQFDTAIVITQSPLLVFNAVVQTRPASCGLNNGCAKAIVTGGTPPYSYLWPGGVITDTSCGLAPASTFTVTVTDNFGCTAVNSNGFVSAVPPHSILASASTPPDCHNGTDGSIIITNVINGLPGAGGFDYEWTPSGTPSSILSTTNALNPTGAGTFVVAITDSLNCTVRDTFILSQPTPISLAFTSKNENCNKQDGSATVTASGGTPPYNNFSWVSSSGITISTAPSVFNLAAGIYTAIVTDNNGCTLSNTVQVLATTPPQINTQATQIQGVNCFGDCTGVIDITPVFGAPPYAYTWISPSGSPISSPNTQDIDSLCIGNYSLTLTDSAGCTFNTSIAVGGNPAISIGSFVYAPSTCGNANGCITATGLSGGVAPYTYLWANGTTSAQVCSLPAGVYSVTVFDTLGCDANFQAALSNIDGPLPALNSVTGITCYGDSTGGIDVSVTGNAPFTYTWTNSQGTIVSNQEDLTGVPAGVYCIEVTDDNDCVNTLCDTIVQPSELVLTGTVNSASCNLSNGIITVTAGGGVPIPPNNYEYFWPDLNLNASVVSGVASGVYTCIVSDQNECKDTLSFIVDQTGIPAVVTASVVIDSADCFAGGDGSVAFVLTGGVQPYSYVWPPGSPVNSITVDSVVLSSLAAGTYFVQVTDDVGCPNIIGPFIVGGPPQIQSQTGTQSATCGNSDGSAWVNFSSGGVAPYTYQWSLSGNPAVLSTDDTLLNAAAGSYILTVTDFYGCTYSRNVDIVNLNGPSLDSLVIISVTCFGDEDGSVAVFASSATAPPLTYQWTFQGANPPPGLDTLTGPAASGLIAGDYIITVRDTNDCPLPVSLTVTQPGLLTDVPDVIQPNPPYNISCFGYNDGAIQTNVTGGTTPYSYVWSNGDTLPFVDSLYAGIYSLLITDANGCTFSEIFSLNQPADILPDPVAGYPGCAGQDTALCGQDLTVTLFACDPLAGVGIWSVISTLGDSVVFQNQNSNTTGVIGLGTGANILQWTVQVNYNQVVCKDSDRVSIFTSDTVIAIGGIDQRVCDGEFRLNATQPAFGTYHWETLSSTDVITFQNSNDPLTDVYGLQYGPNAFIWIVENGSCNDTDTVVVFRNNELDCLSPIDLPTAFSPNFDGKNDYFIVKGLEDYADNELIIYNRWGQVVYEKSGYRNDWYGVGDGGKPVPDGTYFVILKIPLIDKVYKTYIDLRR